MESVGKEIQPLLNALVAVVEIMIQNGEIFGSGGDVVSTESFRDFLGA